MINLNSDKKRIIKKKTEIIGEKNFSKTRNLLIVKLMAVPGGIEPPFAG